MSKTHGQSTKESYRDDIDTSRKQKPVYKIYEYFDDYSYGKSTQVGFYLEKDDEEIYLYLFQEDGPRDIETLRKFLEWRRSGKSNEIGHKGGGNKRNIYGFHCQEAFICMKIDEKNVLRCATKPNSLYELATSDIDEETFRSDSDSSSYITNPEKIKIKNLPGWYSNTFEKIKSESSIVPNFMIRLELTEVPEEYTCKDSWCEFLNQVRAKQYKIPIYFKNELRSMENYETYDNIDVVGLCDKNKINEMNISLYINKETKAFYMKENSKYFNVKNQTDILDNSPEIVEWGVIQMFIVTTEYRDKALKIFNMGHTNNMRGEDFYGIYLILNDKLTNYLPFEGKILGDSRNNGIKVEAGVKNNGRFRIVLRPNEEHCGNSDIFDSLIHTREIKALTGFLDKSPFKEITKASMKMFKNEPICKVGKTKKPKSVKKDKTKDGGVYIVYLGNGLWKYGLVTDYNNMKSRMADHKRCSIDNISSFIGDLSNKELPKRQTCIIVYDKETSTPRACEENIRKTLEDNKGDKIKLFECDRSSNDVREYFVCDDFDYILQYICDNIYNELDE
jgi:sRNA-binding regulator protein Hfq